MRPWIQKNNQPKNLVRNKILFLTFSIFLIGILFFSPALANAASLSLIPSSGSFEVGDRATVKVLVNSSVPYNAVSGNITFPSNIFSVDSVSKSGSVLNFWVTEPTVSGSTVKFEGIALGGSGGSSGTVITVNLRAIKSGSGAASFKSGQILANDGQGTDITGALSSASFSVKEAVVKPPVTLPGAAPALVAPEVAQPKPTLLPPEIVYGTKYGAPAILGSSSYEKAETLVTFVASDGTKVFIVGTSDADGSFNLIIPNSLKRGTYKVTAIMIKGDKTNSEVSNEIAVEVGNLFSDLGWQVFTAFLLLLLVIAYLVLRIFIHFGSKNGSFQAFKKDKKEFQKTETAVHKSFDALRADVKDRAQGVISSVERSNIEALEKDIDSTEKVIVKEIGEIKEVKEGKENNNENQQHE